MDLHNYSIQKSLAESPVYHPRWTQGQSINLSGAICELRVVLAYVFNGNNCPRFFLDSFVDDAETSTYRVLALHGFK